MEKSVETAMRTEQDLLGEVRLPADTLYGINTYRAVNNFPLEHRRTDLSLIYAMVLVKKAAAMAYRDLKAAEPEKQNAIIDACNRILAGGFEDQFPTAALQGGAGTSAHMNVNEVIANLALELLGKAHGEYEVIHPLDDVNRGQSTNDVYPTALRICTINHVRLLAEACAELQTALQEKENEWESIQKAGRTQLMNALPITLGGEFGAYAQAIGRDRWRIYKVEERLRQVNIGGTAVGTGMNAERRYRYRVLENLRELTGLGLAGAEYPMDLTQNQDVFCEVSGLLKALAINLMKISGDIRLMNSEAYSEVHLKPVQQGSTIMPGKVNPVIPEMVTQAAIRVMANDSAITIAAAAGNFELNAFLPLIADSLLESLKLLIGAVRTFTESCIRPLTADPAGCAKGLQHHYGEATSAAKTQGYDQAAREACKKDLSGSGAPAPAGSIYSEVSCIGLKENAF